MNHTEGGWPRDINPDELEQVMRFRKKVEKDETYINSMLQLGALMEHCIKQNNAINIYEEYFEEEISEEHEEIPSAKNVNIFRDPEPAQRTATYLSWSPEGRNKLAVAYAILEFQGAPGVTVNNSYIWDLDNPNQPFLTLKPSASLLCVEYCPKDQNLLVSGCYNGQLALWDIRKGSTPVEVSPIENSHRDPVYSALWLHSKTNTDCFSASTDGRIMWWDIRKLNEPTENLVLHFSKNQPPRLDKAFGACCLEYEATMPTKFMVGTEQGSVLLCNRKAKSPVEKLTAVYNAHLGPVYTLQRNPFFPKNFLTIGDWTARIWSEDIRESSILSTRYFDQALTVGCWSPCRPSVFFVTKSSGYLDVWDILYKQIDPTLSIKVADEALSSIGVHEEGQLVACGSEKGAVSLLKLSIALSNMNKNDKALMTSLLDRESRREKIIEARNREFRLKEKMKNSVAGEHEDVKVEETQEDDLIKQAEKDFYNFINSVSKQREETEENIHND
ncbi:dynein axonemal intermediate chain 2-like isoform X2 [Tachypleus tridentatus]